MPASRKTVDVRTLLDEINRRNRHSVCSAEVRQGWNDLLEMMLFHTFNYEGFRYLAATEVPDGQKPGIQAAPDADGGMRERVFPDETRRVYYVATALRRKGEA